MTRITMDESLQEKLGSLTARVEVCNERGETLGYFIPGRGRERPIGTPAEPPYSEAEIAASRAVRTGKPLEEILSRLGL